MAATRLCAAIFLITHLAAAVAEHTREKRAYACLLTTPDYGYVMGIEVIAKSLRSHGTQYPLICLLSRSLRPGRRSKVDKNIRVDIHHRLLAAGCDVRYVKDIANPHAKTLTRTWFLTTYAKLHLWNQTDYDQLVYLDSDLLVLQPLDNLFERNVIQLGAAPDMLPPDKFQSGLMVLRPSQYTFEAMLSSLSKLDSYDGGDQGFLNSFFSRWYEMPASDRLPVVYNTVQTMSSLYPPAWDALHKKQLIKVIHFSDLTLLRKTELAYPFDMQTARSVLSLEDPADIQRLFSGQAKQDL